MMIRYWFVGLAQRGWWLFLSAVCALVACQQQPPVEPVNVPTPVVVKLAERLEAVGTIKPVQTLTLSFRTGGVIQTLTPLVGAHVVSGTLLAALDPSELTLAQQDAQATLTMRQAQWELASANPQLSQDERIVAETQLRQAQIAVDQLALQAVNSAIIAPFDGVIGVIQRNPGEWADAGQPVLTLLDTRSWLVETRNVSELTISRIQLGQRAQVQVIPFPDQRLTGGVTMISPIAVVQQGDTTYSLLIQLAPTTLPLLTGMNATVVVEIE